MDIRECRVRVTKMRHLVVSGMGTRKLGRFLACMHKWVEESSEMKNRDWQGTNVRGRCSLCM